MNCQPAVPEAVVAPEVAELAPFFPQLEIMCLLGMGGMGMVYKARQPQLDRIVALKILPMDSVQHPSFAERFNREAKTLAKLNHPGIVAIYEFGQTGRYYYFFMEFVDGMNLRDLLNERAVTPRQTLAWVVQICTALQYAHDEGVIHRDIKPANILVNKKGQVKIADFGLAKLMGSAPDMTLTSSHVGLGTPDYMAPEQRTDAQGVDHRADIYSLGVVFYEMLTGEVPMGRFEPPSKKVEVDARLDDVVLRALEREPARRYQKASEVKSGVEALDSIATAATRRMPRWAWPALGSAAALLALAVWLRPYAPALLDHFIKPGPARLVARAEEQLERYDLPGHINGAILDLREAIGLDANLTKAQALLGLAYWRLYQQSERLENRSDAARYSSNALALNPDSAFGWFVQGLVAQDEKRTNAATNCLLLANQKAAWENGEVLIQLASVYGDLLKDMPDSSYFAQKANNVLDKPWYFFYSMGSYEFSLGDYQAAESNFQEATHKAKDSPTAWLSLGAVLLTQTNRDEHARALDYFQKSLRLGATAAAYDDLGEFYWDTGNLLAAATNFHAAARLNPDRYDLPGNEGLVLIVLPASRTQARELLGKAVDKVQSLLKETWNPVAAANLGLYQAALGQGADAFSTLQHALETSPHSQRVRDNIDAAADLLTEVYHSDEAAHLRQLLQEKPAKQ
jgi:tetratricopeptide (TPR) repeat protein/tRNA A-37 threonylcarbamoyl transferase component Bud32